MRKKTTLTYGDALKKSRATAFSLMLKPVGPECNLDCKYCYYLDKVLQTGGGSAPRVMSGEVLEAAVRQHIEANGVDTVSFCWHGGEPLLAGLDFFRKVVELQRRYANGKKIENSIQTNGTLLTPQWASFFASEKFLVGISLDGPAAVHDANRHNKGGAPTFEAVMRGVGELQKAGAEYNTLSAVSAASEGRGREIYRFMKSIGSRYMQFLPVVEHVKDIPGYSREVICSPHDPAGRRAGWSVRAEGYGRFLNDIFDDWVVGDVGDYFVQMFDATLAGWCGLRPGLCSFCESCGDALVVETGGDVYSCDHFVYPEYRLGNVASSELGAMYASPSQFAFGLAKRNTLPADCRRCLWLHLCRGECPKHRFGLPTGSPAESVPAASPGLSSGSGKNSGEMPVNALCEAFKIFYKHSEPYMLRMRELLEAGQIASMVIPWARRRMGLPF